MKRTILFITFLLFVGILFAQQTPDSCFIKAPEKFEKAGCGDPEIHMQFESTCPILNIEITIYNRWGVILYVSNQLDHMWQVKEKNPGTYYFRITGTFTNGNKINQNGYFNLF